jgi:SH3-like domain-containing protein
MLEFNDPSGNGRVTMGDDVRKNMFARTGWVLLLLLMTDLVTGCATKKPEPPPLVEIAEPAPEVVAPRTETVIVHRLNLRSAPSAHSKIRGVLNQGDVVEIHEQQGNWVRVVTPEKKEGWVLAPGDLSGFAQVSVRKKPVLNKEQELVRDKRAAQQQPASTGEREPVAEPHGITSSDSKSEAGVARSAGAGQASVAGSSQDVAAQRPDQLKGADHEMIFIEIVPSREQGDQRKNNGRSREGVQAGSTALQGVAPGSNAPSSNASDPGADPGTVGAAQAAVPGEAPHSKDTKSR